MLTAEELMFSPIRAPLLKIVIVAVAYLLLSSTARMALAAETGEAYHRTGSSAVPVKPIYNPHTKSYFELRVDLPMPPNWSTANKYARTRIFKGVRGRLAVVKDIETHSFLKANFEAKEEVWIGLRFFCSVRKLVWVNGEVHPRNAFKVWAKKWYRTKYKCSTNNFKWMPVYYLPTAKGFRWQAPGPQKYYASYLVEYQTGGE